MSSYSEFARTVADIEQRKGDAIARGQAQRGQAWGSAIANIGEIVSAIPKQRAELERAKQQAQLTDLELKKGAREEQDAARAQAKQQQLQGIFQQYGEDIDGAITAVRQVDPVLGLDLAKRANDSKTAALTYKENTLKGKQQELEFMGSLLGGVTDQASYTQGLYTAKQAGLDVSQLPGDYEQAKTHIDSLRQGTETGRKQVDQQLKAMQEERARLTAEAAMHNQDVDNARQDTRNQQIADHEKVLEQQGAQRNAIAQQRANRLAASGGSGGAAGGLDPDAVEYTATQYRILGPNGIPTRIEGADRVKILNTAARQAKSLGQSPAQAIQKQFRFKSDAASLTQIDKMHSAAQAFETKANAQADLVASLSQKVGRSDWPLINGVIVSGKQATGNTDAHLFANALLTFTNEYAKIIAGSTGAAGADVASRQDAAQLISTALNKGTLQKTIDQMKWEMGQTLSGYDVVEKAISERMGSNTPASGAQPAPSQAAPSVGDIKTFPNGNKGRWDGHGWEQVVK